MSRLAKPMDVRSKIASFEAKNEERRKASPVPVRREQTTYSDENRSFHNHNSTGIPTTNRKAMEPLRSPSPRATPTSFSPYRASPVAAATHNHEPMRDLDPPTSTTSSASYSRITRLQRAVASARQEKPEEEPPVPATSAAAVAHAPRLRHTAHNRRVLGRTDRRHARPAPASPETTPSVTTPSVLVSPPRTTAVASDATGRGKSSLEASPSPGVDSLQQFGRHHSYESEQSSALHQDILQPDLDEDSDIDRPLRSRVATTTVRPNSAQLAAASRRGKIKRIQKIKGFEQVRRYQVKGGANTNDPVMNRRLDHVSPVVPNILPRNKAMRREPAPAPVSASAPRPAISPENTTTNDDEITLTSVRQIVGTSDEKPVQQQRQYEEEPSARLWMDDGEEKNSKAHPPAALMSRSSSSDYETDADRSHGPRPHYGEEALQVPTMSALSASQMTPDVAAFFDQSRRQNVPRDDDDNTYDYGVDDDDDEDSQVSLSYEQRRLKEQREKEARQAAVAAAKAEMEGPFVQHEDVEHYRKSLDTPIVKTAAGVIGAATLGCIVLGPVGLLLGAAAVGIGIGVMQIPEEQREHMGAKATEALQNAQESALNASDVLSNSCATACQESGIAEHVPEELQKCYTAAEDVTEGRGVSGHDEDNTIASENGDEDPDGHGGLRGDPSRNRGPDSTKASTLSRNNNRHRVKEKDKVNCLRKGRIVPVAKIHALDPAAQPKAWLDVLASADTSNDDKMEAMEEILILAKDKQRARVFVEEGILDSVMFTILHHVEKSKSSIGAPANSRQARDEAMAAKLAATCCLTLGKSYCAAIHTEGDLLLMSLYERGSVPEERQLAQMLHEVPFHASTMNGDLSEHRNEAFALKQLTLPQAEELASTIKALAES